MTLGTNGIITNYIHLFCPLRRKEGNLEQSTRLLQDEEILLGAAACRE